MGVHRARPVTIELDGRRVLTRAVARAWTTSAQPPLLSGTGCPFTHLRVHGTTGPNRPASWFDELFRFAGLPILNHDDAAAPHAVRRICTPYPMCH